MYTETFVVGWSSLFAISKDAGETESPPIRYKIVLSTEPATTREREKRMTTGNQSPGWPGKNDRTVVTEMLSDSESRHWYECCEYVKWRIQIKAKNIPQAQREDIVQDVMYKILHALPGFQHNCALTTWINTIILHCIIDAYRKREQAQKYTTSLGNTCDDDEHKPEELIANTPDVANMSIIREELKQAWAAVQEYLSTHGNKERNAIILKMAIIEEKSLNETARAAGCSAAMAGYIVRKIRRYVREHPGYDLPPQQPG